MDLFRDPTFRLAVLTEHRLHGNHQLHARRRQNVNALVSDRKPTNNRVRVDEKQVKASRVGSNELQDGTAWDGHRDSGERREASSAAVNSRSAVCLHVK